MANYAKTAVVDGVRGWDDCYSELVLSTWAGLAAQGIPYAYKKRADAALHLAAIDHVYSQFVQAMWGAHADYISLHTMSKRMACLKLAMDAHHPDLCVGAEFFAADSELEEVTAPWLPNMRDLTAVAAPAYLYTPGAARSATWRQHNLGGHRYATPTMDNYDVVFSRPIGTAGSIAAAREAKRGSDFGSTQGADGRSLGPLDTLLYAVDRTDVQFGVAGKPASIVDILTADMFDDASLPWCVRTGPSTRVQCVDVHSHAYSIAAMPIAMAANPDVVLRIVPRADQHISARLGLGELHSAIAVSLAMSVRARLYVVSSLPTSARPEGTRALFYQPYFDDSPTQGTIQLTPYSVDSHVESVLLPVASLREHVASAQKEVPCL